MKYIIYLSKCFGSNPFDREDYNDLYFKMIAIYLFAAIFVAQSWSSKEIEYSFPPGSSFPTEIIVSKEIEYSFPPGSSLISREAPPVIAVMTPYSGVKYQSLFLPTVIPQVTINPVQRRTIIRVR